jgi:carboxymethylenebutenolidase
MDAQHEGILGVVRKALDDLLAHPDARGARAGIVALSFGGWYGHQVSKSRADDVAALVSIYSDVFEGPEGVAYLGHFAEDDQFVNSAAEIEAATDRGEAHVYAGAKHWFMENDRPEYDAEAAELAYSRTVEFLRQHLA